MEAIDALTFFTALASILWLIVKFKNSKPAEEPSTPPGPVGLPIVGYLPFLNSNLPRQMNQLSKKYGPIFKFWLGSKLCIVITSPSLIKQVVRDHDTTFAYRDATIAATLATGQLDLLFMPYGQHWRALRKLFVKEMLSISSLDASYAIRRQEIHKLARKVCAEVGRKLKVGELIFTTEMNVATNLIWGGIEEDFVTIGVEFRKVLWKMVDLMGTSNVSDFFPVLAKLDIQGIEKEMKILVTTLDTIFDSVICSCRN